jgi:hypothetical protein
MHFLSCISNHSFSLYPAGNQLQCLFSHRGVQTDTALPLTRVGDYLRGEKIAGDLH